MLELIRETIGGADEDRTRDLLNAICGRVAFASIAC